MANAMPPKRCAIYVRKSSEEGLDMSYNSLEAQCDACAAYIASQRHEGWTMLPDHYEDGGYSGGNMDRPGLKQLMTDVAADKIDIIVVYKIDRLTRSLTDFAKLSDILDKNEVSFVAVTQQFNTSTSMGRLTLNVLLSFAQFEREVSGERIRDKVAASKKKGMWMGGPVPFGYEVKDRKLIVIPDQARIVRRMYERYLEVKSVHDLQRELEQQGVRSRARPTKDGSIAGNAVLGHGAISHMLKNPLYAGLIRHQGDLHQGQHVPIVDRQLFERVRAALEARGPGKEARSKRHSGSLLQGIAFDENGNRLLPTYSIKGGKRYHYYTSARRLRSAGDDPQGIRVPAGDLEGVVLRTIADHLRDESKMERWLNKKVPLETLRLTLERCRNLAHQLSTKVSSTAANPIDLIQEVRVSKDMIRITLCKMGLVKALGITAPQVTHADTRKKIDVAAHDTDFASTATSDDVVISVKSHLLRCGKQVKLILGHKPNDANRVDPKLVDMVAKPRKWFEGLTSGKYPTLQAIATTEKLDKSYVSRLLSIAFLAPDIVEQIVTGSHPATLTPEKLRKACPLPINWDEQRALLLN